MHEVGHPLLHHPTATSSQGKLFWHQRPQACVAARAGSEASRIVYTVAGLSPIKQLATICWLLAGMARPRLLLLLLLRMAAAAPSK
jgi:hypothetical protein